MAVRDHCPSRFPPSDVIPYKTRLPLPPNRLQNVITDRHHVHGTSSHIVAYSPSTLTSSCLQVRAIYISPDGSCRFTRATVHSKHDVRLTTPISGWNGSGPLSRVVGNGSDILLQANISNDLEHATLTTTSELRDWHAHGLFLRLGKRSGRVVNARTSDKSCACEWTIRSIRHLSYTGP